MRRGHVRTLELTKATHHEQEQQQHQQKQQGLLGRCPGAGATPALGACAWGGVPADDVLPPRRRQADPEPEVDVGRSPGSGALDICAHSEPASTRPTE